MSAQRLQALDARLPTVARAARHAEHTRACGMPGSGRANYLVFNIGPAHYAFDLQQVREVHEYQRPNGLVLAAERLLPCAIDEDGDEVPMLGLSHDRSAPPRSDRAGVTIVVEAEGRKACVVADALVDVIDLDDSDWAPPVPRRLDQSDTAADPSFIRGHAWLRNGGRERALAPVDIERWIATRIAKE